MNHLQSQRQFADRSFGFENLYAAQMCKKPGLILIGGRPAVGKTTFAWQIAEQMARAGEDVIYVTLEMSKNELFAKSVAREIAAKDPRTKLTSSNLSDNLDFQNQEMTIIAEQMALASLQEMRLRVLELRD